MRARTPEVITPFTSHAELRTCRSPGDEIQKPRKHLRDPSNPSTAVPLTADKLRELKLHEEEEDGDDAILPVEEEWTAFV